MPVGGNVSYYQRRKYSPQAPPDHQSRIFFGEYAASPESGRERCRSDGSVSSTATNQSSSPSSISVNSAPLVADTVNGNKPQPETESGSVNLLLLPPKCTDRVAPAPECCVRTGSTQVVGSVGEPAGGVGGVGGGGASSTGTVGAAAGRASNSVNSGNASVSGQRRQQQYPSVVGVTGTFAGEQSNGPNLPSATSAHGGSYGRSTAPSTGVSGVTSFQAKGGGRASASNNNNEDCGQPNSPGPASSSGSNNNYQLGNGNTGDQQQQQQQQQSKYTTTTTGNTTSAAATKQQALHQQQQQQSSFSKQPTLVQPQQQQSTSLSGHPAQHPASVSYHPTSGGGPVAGSGLLRSADSNPFASSTAGAASQHHLQQQQQQHYQQPLQPQTGSVNVNVTVNVVARSVTAGTMTTTTATTTSTTTLAPPRPMQKVIPTVVYLMSRIAVHMEIEGTAQCPAQVMLAAALGCEELGITNKLLAQSVFGLWMTSPLLEVQLKPHHRPYAVRVAWSKLLDKHSHGNELEKLSDEPMTTLRRNVFFSRKDEEKIKDPRILELLYEEARHNVLLGRYVMEPSQSIMLGGIQARIELGPYNSHTHTTSYFRENQFRFLPAHVAKSSSWSWLPISQRSSAEVRLLEQFKRVPTTATTKKLMRKYLEFCWGLPFYGAAYFHGQVEQPVRGLMSLMQQKDLPVLIAVNERGIFVIDQIECTLLLGLKYEEFSWEYAKPSNVNDPECLPCIFLQFGAVENGIAATKLMQIFSRQAAMVDALITHFIEQDKRRKESGADADQAGGLADNTYVEPNPIKNNGIGVLSNKFARLTLATFDDEGRCIGQTGSLSISY
ncbi:uncharacterized protein LOC125959276 [Anopheles darlingi]|uniref:uncharacterized protein LOC125959276 n=1 Tax=Anopheles darlingi TaxID=43151 RepID=UPI0021004A14|nr:uncharacterized protein LOC125959276 [Anopheles darlingi]